MPWLFALFVMLPAIMVLSKIFEKGYGGLIVVPIFGLIALIPFGYVWRRAKRLGFPGTALVRGICLLLFAYLCHKVYVGTLPAWEFPTVKPGQLRGDETAEFTGWGGLALLFIGVFFAHRHDTKASEHTFSATAVRQFGRAPDVDLRSRDKRGHWRLMIWVAEKRFYYADDKMTFDARHVRTIGDIRGWTVEKSQKVIKEQLVDVYTVDILLKGAADPLIEFFCGQNKAAAFQVAEAFNQMSESDVTATLNAMAAL